MTANSTKAYRAALAAVACGAVLLSAAPTASAAASNAADIKVASSTAEQKAADAAAAAAAKKAAADAAAAVKKAIADAAATAKKVAADIAAAQKVADAAAKKAAADVAASEAAAKKAAAETAAAQKAAEIAAQKAAEAAAKQAAAEAAAAKKAADAAAKQAAADAAAAKKAADAAAKKAAADAAAAAKKTAAEAAKKAAADAAAAKKAAAEAAKVAAAAAKAEAAAKAKAAKDAAALAAKEAKDALTIPEAPVNLSVLRSASALNDFTVSWTAPAGKVDRYDVTVYVDGTKTLYSGLKTSLTIKGRSLQSVYRIEVAARDKQDRGAVSTIVLAPAVPGAPTGLATSAISATAGITLSWSPPTRSGVSGIDHYRVLMRDTTTGDDVTLNTTELTAVFAEADPLHNFEATITAVTPDGDGLPMTVDIGDTTSTLPRGFTAIRDPHTPTEVNLAWSPPVWQAADPITGYEVGVAGADGMVWTDVGLTESITLPLPLDKRAAYAVRAVNASGPSPSNDAEVDLGIKTQLPSSSSPVVLSTADRQVDVALFGWVGDESLDKLVITNSTTTGKYRSEQVTDNGSDGVAFRDLANGTYTVTVVGHNSDTGEEVALFDGTISIDGDTVGSSSVESSFDAGEGYWHGVYPGRHLPRVVSTKDISYEGTGSLAVTATWDSTNANITAGTSGFGGIPVKAKQAVTVSALGRPGASSDWNMGISWWDAKGNQISLVRAKRVTGVINAWRPSQSTYTAPAGAVSATAFIEIGGLKSGETFYVDGITLKSQ
jgi:hypothetical protein